MVAISGGDKLAAALQRLSTQVSKAATLEVGFPEGATEPNGQSTALIAAIQEWGAPGKGIPPRPFFRTMISKNAPAWPGQLAVLLKSNDYDSADALEILGQIIEAELAQSIVDMNDPPLSPITVMLRGMKSQGKYQGWGFGALIKEAASRVAAGKTNYGASTKPLVESGTMLSNIKHTVT